MNWFMRKLKISLMLLLTITQACASSSAEKPVSIESEGEESGTIEVRVSNYSRTAPRIYALYRGRQRFLGTIRNGDSIRNIRDGGRGMVFVIDWFGSEELRLGVNLDRGMSCTTPPVMVSSGALIDFEVPDGRQANPGDGAGKRYMRSDGYQEDMGLICNMVVR